MRYQVLILPLSGVILPLFCVKFCVKVVYVEFSSLDLNPSELLFDLAKALTLFYFLVLVLV